VTTEAEVIAVAWVRTVRGHECAVLFTVVVHHVPLDDAPHCMLYVNTRELVLECTPCSHEMRWKHDGEVYDVGESQVDITNTAQRRKCLGS